MVARYGTARICQRRQEPIPGGSRIRQEFTRLERRPFVLGESRPLSLPERLRAPVPSATEAAMKASNTSHRPWTLLFSSSSFLPLRPATLRCERVVLSVDPAHHSMRVSCDEIRGVMEGMIMTFAVPTRNLSPR